MTSYISAGFIAQLLACVPMLGVLFGLQLRISVLLDYAGLVSKYREIQAILEVKLAVDRTKMMPHCRLTEPQALCDTFVCRTVADELYDLDLPLGQLVHTRAAMRSI